MNLSTYLLLVKHNTASIPLKYVKLTKVATALSGVPKAVDFARS